VRVIGELRAYLAVRRKDVKFRLNGGDGEWTMVHFGEPARADACRVFGSSFRR